jgi:hypothetical protein
MQAGQGGNFILYFRLILLKKRENKMAPLILYTKPDHISCERKGREERKKKAKHDEGERCKGRGAQEKQL